MIKVYKINGKTESHEVFTSPSGKTTYKVTFSKGNLDPKNRVPAKYATASPVIQFVIENDARFGKTIFLDKIYGEPAPAPAAAPAAPKAKGKAAKTEKDVKVMEDVKTLAEAWTVLTAEGAPAADMDNTLEGALRAAKKLDISFPNLKAE